MGAESGKFVLLSDALRAVRRDRDGSPQFREWKGLDLGAVDLDSPVFDERGVDGIVNDMLDGVREAFAGVYLPDSVRNLRDAYAAKIKDPDGYLEFALSEQRARLAGFIAANPINVDAETKKFRNMARGAQKRLSDFDDLLNDPTDYIKSRGLYHIRRLGVDRFFLDARVDEISLLAGNDLMNELRRRYDEILAIDSCGELLAIKIDMVNEANAVLRSTIADLSQLIRGRINDVVVGVCEPVREKEEVSNSGLPRKRPKQKKAKGKGSPSKDRNNNGTETEKRFSDPINISLRQLRGFVEIANRFSEVRLLTGRTESYVAEWENLLEHFGFRGELRIVKYLDLKRTSDIETPVLVPRPMNTHEGLWNRARFKNLVVVNDGNPVVIARHLEREGKR